MQPSAEERTAGNAAERRHDQPCGPPRRFTQLGVGHRLQNAGDKPMKVNRVTVEEGASYSKAPSHHADRLRMR